MTEVDILCVVGSTCLAGDPAADAIIDEVYDRLRPRKVISGCAPGIEHHGREQSQETRHPV
jgi:hypothetical protein